MISALTCSGVWRSQRNRWRCFSSWDICLHLRTWNVVMENYFHVCARTYVCMYSSACISLSFYLPVWLSVYCVRLIRTYNTVIGTTSYDLKCGRYKCKYRLSQDTLKSEVKCTHSQLTSISASLLPLWCERWHTQLPYPAEQCVCSRRWGPCMRRNYRIYGVV